ncbi:MAG: hypothetical protein ACM65L_25645 [Microcoleus sp.]
MPTDADGNVLPGCARTIPLRLLREMIDIIILRGESDHGIGRDGLGFIALARIDREHTIHDSSITSEDGTIEEKIRVLSKLTKEVIVRSNEGNIERQHIRQIRLTGNKLLRRLMLLEKGEISEDRHRTLEEEIEKEISQIFMLLLRITS